MQEPEGRACVWGRALAPSPVMVLSGSELELCPVWRCRCCKTSCTRGEKKKTQEGHHGGQYVCVELTMSRAGRVGLKMCSAIPVLPRVAKNDAGATWRVPLRGLARRA